MPRLPPRSWLPCRKSWKGLPSRRLCSGTSTGLIRAPTTVRLRVAYFRNESATSHARLDALSSSVELDRVREIIRMYCRMLAGREIEVQASQQLVNKKIGWFQGELPDYGRYHDLSAQSD